jgi:hypothetical protein
MDAKKYFKDQILAMKNIKPRIVDMNINFIINDIPFKESNTDRVKKYLQSLSLGKMVTTNKLANILQIHPADYSLKKLSDYQVRYNGIKYWGNIDTIKKFKEKYL